MANRKSRANSLPMLLMVFCGLLVLSIGGWLGWQLVKPAHTPEPTPSQAVNSQDIERLNLVDAKVAYDQNKALFVDVRDANAYASDHIPGALSIPLNELPDRLGELDPNAWIITYCT